MSKTAFQGPLIVYGDRAPAGVTGALNPDKAPSLFWGGTAIFDHRSGYNKTRAGAIGVWSQMCLDVVPSALTTTAIAAAQVPVAGTAMTLVSSTGAGVTYLSTALQVWPSGATVPAAALALDGAPTLLAFGTASISTGNTTVSIYNPSTALARNIQIASVGDDSAATFVVRGYDVYGYAMTETITGTNATTAQGKKAFKFVVSITPAGTLSGSNASAGQGDKFGFPVRADTFNYVRVVWNNTFAASTTTPFGTASAYAFADATTATATTGDVRGTVYAGTANPSNATRRLQVQVIPSAINLQAGGTTGLFGVTQA